MTLMVLLYLVNVPLVAAALESANDKQDATNVERILDSAEDDLDQVAKVTKSAVVQTPANIKPAVKTTGKKKRSKEKDEPLSDQDEEFHLSVIDEEEANDSFGNDAYQEEPSLDILVAPTTLKSKTNMLPAQKNYQAMPAKRPAAKPRTISAAAKNGKPCYLNLFID